MRERKYRSFGELIHAFGLYMKTQSAIRLLIYIVYVALMAFLFMIAIVPARYDLRVGQVPNVTITASKDVVDEVTTEQKRKEAAAQVTPTYKYQEGITEAVLNQYEQIFAQLRAVRQYGETLPDRVENRTYSREELDYASSMLTQVTLRDYQLKTLMNSDSETLEELHDTLHDAIENTLSGHVTQGQESEAIQSISMIVGYRTDVDLLQNVVMPVLKVCIQPNMVIDQEATEKDREKARAAVENVIYKQGQNIVVQGEGRITLSQLKMLETLGLLRSGTADLNSYFGSIALILLTLIVLIIMLKISIPQIMKSTRNVLVICLLMILTFSLCILTRYINANMVPVIMVSILLSTMLSLRAAVLCNCAIALLTAALAAGGDKAYTAQMVNIISTSVLSGSVAAIMTHHSISRIRAMLSGLVAGAINMVIVLSIGLMTATAMSNVIGDAIFCALGAVIAGVLATVLQPLFEGLFNLPTPARLLELSNPNSPLLRRMMLEAPGTYHHCILVANLAEASAEAIGVNQLLARVGAYYHDIGKLKRPEYFKENQIGIENAHDHNDPYVSASILTAHTQDGVAMAKAYRLPVEIQKIISEHHGNTPVMYFYHKALQLSETGEVDIDLFRYDGERPSTKESAIIMLCDTIEAAVRSRASDADNDDLEEYIVKLVRDKLADGQLNNSPLTLNDLDQICIACVKVLKGVYHERVKYPEVQVPHKHHTLSKKLKPSEEKKPEEINIKDPTPVEVHMVELEKAEETREVPVPDIDSKEDYVVEPMPVAAPVEIDKLIQLEPITGKTEETAEEPEEVEETAETEQPEEETKESVVEDTAVTPEDKDKEN